MEKSKEDTEAKMSNLLDIIIVAVIIIIYFKFIHKKRGKDEDGKAPPKVIEVEHE